MTHFVLSDEFERDFEPLEEHPARHAAAVAMYCLTGQRCAQRMTDGIIPSQVIAKTFAAWPSAMRATAIADLVAIDKWTETDEGGLQFVDWDLTQFTAEQEISRREKQAARQRARRAALKRKAESAAVTRDVPVDEARDVAGDVTVPSASASASLSTSASPEGERASAPPGSAAPALAEGMSADGGVYWAELWTVWSEEALRQGYAAAPRPTRDQQGKAAGLIRDMARNSGRTYAECALAHSRLVLASAKPGKAWLEFLSPGKPGGTVHQLAPPARVLSRQTEEALRAAEGDDPWR